MVLSDYELLHYDQSNTDVWTSSVYESYWHSAVDRHFYVTNNITKYCELLGRAVCWLFVVIWKAVLRITECAVPVGRHSTVLCGFETCWHKIEWNGASNRNLHTSSVTNCIKYRVL